MTYVIKTKLLISAFTKSVNEKCHHSMIVTGRVLCERLGALTQNEKEYLRCLVLKSNFVPSDNSTELSSILVRLV